jgi:large subunit ribosomal protein L15
MHHLIKPAKGATHRRKRVARGNSAGGGTTAGRGTKGQQSRTGKGRRFGFEGGQVPMLMRQPKMGGFTRSRKIHYEVLNVEKLEERLAPGAYTAADLRAEGLVSSKRPLKILGQGKVTKKFELSAHAFSKSAKDALTKAGGTVKVLKD